MNPSLARRGFLRLMSAAPFAGKAVAEEAAARLSGVVASGAGNHLIGAELPQSGRSALPDMTERHYRAAYQIPGLREAAETILYREQMREVSFIDPDLAVLKSFSLQAKITFQRQRNVQRYIERQQNEAPWRRVDQLIMKALGL